MILIDDYVAEMFANAPDRCQPTRRNPVTSGLFVPGLDSIKVQRKQATRALTGRDWFANQKPANAPELPLTYDDREELKGGDPLRYIVSLFARSLAPDYEVARHPDFNTYARGVMASPNTPNWIRQDPNMLRRYPPLPLEGLGGGLIWRGR
jgi:hypothetical protein